MSAPVVPTRVGCTSSARVVGHGSSGCRRRSSAGPNSPARLHTQPCKRSPVLCTVRTPVEDAGVRTTANRMRRGGHAHRWTGEVVGSNKGKVCLGGRELRAPGEVVGFLAPLRCHRPIHWSHYYTSKILTLPEAAPRRRRSRIGAQRDRSDRSSPSTRPNRGRRAPIGTKNLAGWPPKANS